MVNRHQDGIVGEVSLQWGIHKFPGEPVVEGIQHKAWSVERGGSVNSGSIEKENQMMKFLIQLMQVSTIPVYTREVYMYNVRVG